MLTNDGDITRGRDRLISVTLDRRQILTMLPKTVLFNEVISHEPMSDGKDGLRPPTARPGMSSLADKWNS